VPGAFFRKETWFSQIDELLIWLAKHLEFNADDKNILFVCQPFITAPHHSMQKFKNDYIIYDLVLD
jgi:hypothetical protein